MITDNFKKIIAEWFERTLPNAIPRDIPLHLTDDIIAIVGPRRVGKTYLMFQLIHQLLKEHAKQEIMRKFFSCLSIKVLEVYKSNPICSFIIFLISCDIRGLRET